MADVRMLMKTLEDCHLFDCRKGTKQTPQANGLDSRLSDSSSASSGGDVGVDREASDPKASSQPIPSSPANKPSLRNYEASPAVSRDAVPQEIDRESAYEPADTSLGASGSEKEAKA